MKRICCRVWMTIPQREMLDRTEISFTLRILSYKNLEKLCTIHTCSTIFLILGQLVTKIKAQLDIIILNGHQEKDKPEK